ncbi:MAG: hypothetical protein ACE5HG_04140, partial [Candidatus Bathyarchaeia archaeon]
PEYVRVLHTRTKKEGKLSARAAAGEKSLCPKKFFFWRPKDYYLPENWMNRKGRNNVENYVKKLEGGSIYREKN